MDKMATQIPRMATAINSSKVIIAGDLNLHNLGETSFLYESQFRDTWLEVNGLDPGYSWDSIRNSLIRTLLKFDNRRMRLDRIAVADFWNLQNNQDRLELDPKNTCTYIIPTAMNIVNTKPVESLTALKTKLNASDHFGLEAHFSIFRDVYYSSLKQSLSKDRASQIVKDWEHLARNFKHFDYYGREEEILNGRDRNSTGFRSLKKTILLRLGIGAGVVTGVVGGALYGLVGHVF